MLKILKSEHPINSTADLVPEAQIKRDVKKIIDVVYDGGVAILPLDVAYAIVGCTEDAIKSVVAATGASVDNDKVKSKSGQEGVVYDVLKSKEGKALVVVKFQNNGNTTISKYGEGFSDINDISK